MTFADLPAGASIFLDANPLVYHFAPDPKFGAASSQLLARIVNHEIQAFTSTHVLSEVAHQLMLLEAANLFGWTTKITGRLKQQPTLIQKLTNFRTSIETVLQMNIQVFTIPPDWIATAAALSQQYSLFSNDALIVTIMQAHGLTSLASNDGDFDRVPGLTRYAPV
jgi:predicted nucleic acid-binding protein